MSGRYEVEVIVDGVTIDYSQIFSLKTYNKLFNDQFAVGTTANGTIDLVIGNPNQPFSRMATIAVRVRDIDTDWEPRGTYYIDTRETIVSGGKSKLHIIGYDGMLKTSRVIDFSAISTWPSTTASVVQFIAQQSGIQVDTDTISRLNDGTTMPKPEYLTGREVLECIGAMHCGSFVMSNSNKLVFIDTVSLLKSKVRSSVPNIMRSALSATVCSRPTTYSRVELTRDENTTFTSGVATGAVVKADIPWATQELADSMCSIISGTTYQPYTASGVAVGVLASLGDKISVNESDNAIFEIGVDYKSPAYATIAAPGADEVEHEFDYVPKIERQTKRAIGGVARMLNDITEFDDNGDRVVAKKSLTAVFEADGTFKTSNLSLSVIEHVNADGTKEYRTMANLAADVVDIRGKVRNLTIVGDEARLGSALYVAGQTTINGNLVATGHIQSSDGVIYLRGVPYRPQPIKFISSVSGSPAIIAVDANINGSWSQQSTRQISTSDVFYNSNGSVRYRVTSSGGYTANEQEEVFLVEDTSAAFANYAFEEDTEIYDWDA